MNEFDEFKRQWGVDGMSADKIRLATEAFKAGMLAAAEIANDVNNLGIEEKIIASIEAKAKEL